jgi:ornithine--oxo-acid transaminase
MAELDLRALLAERSAGTLDLHARTVNPQFVRLLRTIGFDRTWSRAEGAYFFDAKGERYLDMLGAFGMYNVGRNNPTVRRALEQALELDLPGRVQLGITALPSILAERLLALAPPSVQKVLFTSSGTESVEAAIKLGRAATGRSRVVTANHAFHGLTLGSLSATAAGEFAGRFQPLLPGFTRVAWGSLDAIEQELRSKDVALVLLEPIQGKGLNLPPPGYLEGVQEICRRTGTLLCIDEVQTGLGRTGKMFALEHWGLEPDMVTVAKSLSGGYVPSGALLLSDRIFDEVFDSLENALAHGSTFAPGDFAMAAGLATLHELERRSLVAHSARMGQLLLERTRPLVDRYEVVKDVRGLGLMWAIEFGEPEKGKLSWQLVEKAQQGLFSQLVVVPLFEEHRVMTQVAGHNLNVIKVLPPLVFSEDDLDWFVTSLVDTLEGAQRLGRSAVGFALKMTKAGASASLRRQ